MTKQQLQDDLRRAMLTKDALRTSVLRLLLSAINYYEIQRGGANYEATEEDITNVVKKEAKQHKDSIEQFQKAGRQDLVDKETKELQILQAYLPAQMSEEELRILVIDAIDQTGAISSSDIGKVMSIVMPKVKGRADGSLVSKIVKEELS